MSGADRATPSRQSSRPARVPPDLVTLHPVQIVVG